MFTPPFFFLFFSLVEFILKPYFCFWQWAEVLSADAFSAFEDAGLDDNKVSPKELYGKIGLHSLAIYLNNFFFV